MAEWSKSYGDLTKGLILPFCGGASERVYVQPARQAYLVVTYVLARYFYERPTFSIYNNSHPRAKQGAAL